MYIVFIGPGCKQPCGCVVTGKGEMNSQQDELGLAHVCRPVVVRKGIWPKTAPMLK